MQAMDNFVPGPLSSQILTTDQGQTQWNYYGGQTETDRDISYT